VSLIPSRPYSLGRLSGKRPNHRIGSLLLAVALTASALTALAAAPATAATACDPGSDTCVILPDTVQTPLGPVTVTVSTGNVVTVQLDPTAPNTLVFGIPFAIPPGPPAAPQYVRQSIVTAGGIVNIDTILAPPGPPRLFAMPSLAIISIHPPGPCRVSANGTTVVFTPIFPPGPPT
jgi:hypothetical protein